MKLRDLRVGTRLTLGFGVVLALLLAIAGIGHWHLQTMGDLINRMRAEGLVKERLASEWHSLTHVNGARTIGVISSADADERKRAVLCLRPGTAATRWRRSG